MTVRLFTAAVLCASLISGIAGYSAAYRQRPHDALTAEQHAYYQQLVDREAAAYKEQLADNAKANADATRQHLAKEDQFYSYLAQIVAADAKRGVVKPSLANRILTRARRGAV